MTKLPDGWAPESLSEVCLPVTKADPVSTGRKLVRYVDIGSVDGVRHRLPEVPWMDSKSAPSRCRQIVKVGDTVFSTVRPYLEKIAFVDGSLDGEFASTGFCVLRPGPQLLPRYLFHFSVSHQMLDQVLIHQRGVSYPAVLDKNVKAATIPVPPLEEQRRIVDILEDHISRLDAATGLLDLTHQRLRTLRKALWGNQFGDQDQDKERLAEPLLDLVVIANGQTPKGLVGALLKEPSDDTVPFYKVGDMNLSDGRLMGPTRSYVRVADARLLGLHIRKAGTVLFPKRGGAIATNKKRLLSSEAAYDLNTMGLVPGPRLRPAYLWHWLEGIDLARLSDGSNVPQINSPQMRGLSLSAPSLEVQDLMVSVMDENDQAISRVIAEMHQARSRSEQLRLGLLAAAFSGRLTGRSSDTEMVEEMAGV